MHKFRQKNLKISESKNQRNEHNCCSENKELRQIIQNLQEELTKMKQAQQNQKNELQEQKNLNQKLLAKIYILEDQIEKSHTITPLRQQNFRVEWNNYTPQKSQKNLSIISPFSERDSQQSTLYKNQSSKILENQKILSNFDSLQRKERTPNKIENTENQASSIDKVSIQKLRETVSKKLQKVQEYTNNFKSKQQ